MILRKMSTRKKKGVSAFVSGLACIALGAVFLKTDTTPEFVQIAITGIGAALNAFGMKLVYPDMD